LFPYSYGATHMIKNLSTSNKDVYQQHRLF